MVARRRYKLFEYPALFRCRSVRVAASDHIGQFDPCGRRHLRSHNRPLYGQGVMISEMRAPGNILDEATSSPQSH